jgi:biopolymer transport protein ExbD
MFEKTFNAFDETVNKAELSMTPLIDMVFLLLIFFAVTTNFTKETGIQVNKASASTAKIFNKDLILISIDRDGNYWYDGKVQQLQSIANQVIESAKQKPEMSIVLIPDKEGRVDPLIQLMDILRANGISRFSIGTKMVNGKQNQ